MDAKPHEVVLNLTIVAENCGANFFNGISDQEAVTNFEQPPVERIHLISGIYLGCMVLASLIVIFGVDSLSR